MSQDEEAQFRVDLDMPIALASGSVHSASGSSRQSCFGRRKMRGASGPPFRQIWGIGSEALGSEGSPTGVRSRVRADARLLAGSPSPRIAAVATLKATCTGYPDAIAI